MRRSEIARQFDAIVAFAEIEQFLDTPVKHYSSGMYMRLAFAVAAHLEPEILVVDEVLAVGDAEFQKKCLGKMRAVAHAGRTVLFVSHNMNAIEELCERVIWLSLGEIQCASTGVRKVISDYLFGSSQDGPAGEWLNPSNLFANPYFRPVRLAICDESGRTAPQPLRNDADVFVHIEAEIERLDSALTIGYAIYAESGDLLYWSYHTDSSIERWPKTRLGRQTLRSKLPKRLLNEGTYRIELLGGLHFRSWFFKPGGGPSVILTVQGGLSDSPLWMIRRPGLLAPVLEWMVE